VSETRPAPELHATVYGLVQGVGFRQFVVREARARGLRGWVRNGPHGDAVEVLARGDRARLEELLALIRRGPRGAVVRRVECEWSEAPDDPPGFTVRF